MLFTKTGAENITVTNFQGVRSAQCNAQFDELPQMISEPIFNSSDADKTWVEEPPVRIEYTMHINKKEKEEKTQAVFVTLTVIFFVIIICCGIEVYRTNRAHRRRIERETDEGIIRSKEQATKLHESPGVKPYTYKSVPTEEVNGGGQTIPIVGILKNGIAGTTILEEPEGTTSETEWEEKNERVKVRTPNESNGGAPRRSSTPKNSECYSEYGYGTGRVAFILLCQIFRCHPRVVHRNSDNSISNSWRHFNLPEIQRLATSYPRLKYLIGSPADFPEQFSTVKHFNLTSAQIGPY